MILAWWHPRSRLSSIELLCRQDGAPGPHGVSGDTRTLSAHLSHAWWVCKVLFSLSLSLHPCINIFFEVCWGGVAAAPAAVVAPAAVAAPAAAFLPFFSFVTTFKIQDGLTKSVCIRPMPTRIGIHTRSECTLHYTCLLFAVPSWLEHQMNWLFSLSYLKLFFGRRRIDTYLTRKNVRLQLS